MQDSSFAMKLKIKSSKISDCPLVLCRFQTDFTYFVHNKSYSGFTKLHKGLVVLVKLISDLINFLLQNTKFLSVLGKIMPKLCWSCLTGLTNFVNSQILLCDCKIRSYNQGADPVCVVELTRRSQFTVVVIIGSPLFICYSC